MARRNPGATATAALCGTTPTGRPRWPTPRGSVGSGGRGLLPDPELGLGAAPGTARCCDASVVELRFPEDRSVGVLSWVGSFTAAHGPTLARGVVSVPDGLDVQLEVGIVTDVQPMGRGSWSMGVDSALVDLVFLDYLPPDAITAVVLCRVVAASVPSLARLAPALRRLVLADTGLHDDALRTIGCLAGLTSLQTWGNEFTDEGVAALVALQRLEFLFLEEATLTLAAFDVARTLPNLTTLGCQDARLNDEELEELRRDLPGVRVSR